MADKEVMVTLTDTNNQVPVFQGLSSESGRYMGQIQENMPMDSSIITITASDADETLQFKTVRDCLTFTAYFQGPFLNLRYFAE
jgi:hypothetical protein